MDEQIQSGNQETNNQGFKPLDQILKERQDIGTQMFKAAPEQRVAPIAMTEEKAKTEAEARNRILAQRQQINQKQKEQFEKDKETMAASENVERFVSNPTLVSTVASGKFQVNPKDLLTGKAMSVDEMQQYQQRLAKGGREAMQAYLELSAPKVKNDIELKAETNKQENIERLKSSVSDNDFLKHTNLKLYQQQIDRDNEEQSLFSENSNVLGGLFDNRISPVIRKDGKIDPELKAQALVGGLNNPYSVYYKKGAEQRVNPNSLAVVTDGLVADKIEQHSKIKSEWQQISDAVQTGARYGLGNVSKYTSSPLAEYTSAVVRGAMTTASFVDAALNGTVFSGTGFNSNAFFDALERNQKVIDKFAPASPEFKDKNILDEAAIMLGEFQAGGEVAKVLPFAGNLTRARNAKLAGLLSSEAKPMNALTALYLRGYSSTPVKYATKYLDNFVNMNIAGTPVVYTNAYAANRMQGDSREEASKKALIESQVLAGTMSVFGTLLHGEPHGDIAKTMLGKPEVKNWVGKRVEKINQAFNSVGMSTPAKIAQKTAMGSLEFSMFDSYMEYRRQKEEHNKLIENGQIPENTPFKMNPEKLLIAAKHGAMMGGLVGAIGVIRDGKTDFLQGDAVALAIKDPDQFKLSLQQALDNGYLTAESAKQLESFVAVVKPKYLALEGATTPVFKNGKQVGSVKMDDNTRVAIAVRQARMAEIQNNLDLYKNKAEQYSERKIIDLEIQAANEQRDINKLETGTVVKGQLFTPKDVAKMAKDYTERGMLEKQRAELKANGAYKAETVDLEQFKTDEDVKAYLAVKENSEAAQEFKTQLDEIETKLAKISAAEKLGKKLSLREQSEKESLMDERAKLKADNALFAKHLDILDFSDPHNLAPVIGKDGNIIDGKKRIAAAIAKGDKNIEVLRPLTEAEHAEMLNEREEDVFGANEPNYEGLDVEDAARLRAARAAYDNAGGRAAGVAAAKESLRKGEKLYETEESTSKVASDIEARRVEKLNNAFLEQEEYINNFKKLLKYGKTVREAFNNLFDIQRNTGKDSEEGKLFDYINNSINPDAVRVNSDTEENVQDYINEGIENLQKAKNSKRPDSRINKINAEHDGLYLKAVEDGKMSREEAMQALEKAGRKDSEAYRQIEATEPTQATEEPTQTKPEEPITEEKLTDLLGRVSPEVVNPVLAEAAAKMDMPVPEVKPVQTFKPNKILKGINDTIHKIATKLRGSRPAPRLVLSVSVDDAKRIADAYEEMKHDPNNPEVKRGFEELVTEIKKQADALLADGYTFELTTKGEGYGSNSEKTFKDVKENKRILVESSEESFGTDRKFDKDNIGLMDSGYKDVNGRPLTNVELIRGVHDLFGHSEYGNGFGAIGEENAWRIHMSMFSPLAQKALTATTRGQNSWVNFGKHMRNADGSIKKKGDEGYMDAASRPFAEQKIGFLPDWATDNAYGDVVELNGKEVKPVNKFVVDGKAMYDIDDPVAFRDALIAAKENRKANGKNDWIQVHAKTEKEYEELLKQGGHLLVSKDGKVGIAVGADGFVGSGFAHVDAPKGALAPLLNMAIKLGARYTDAFDTYLPEYYAKFGFKASGRMKFDEAMAEEGWSDTILKDKPDVVFMYYDGGDRMTIDKRFGEFEEYSKTDGEYVNSYDEGVTQSKLVSDNIEPEASLLPVEPETKPVSETEALSPKNMKDLYNINRELFGLNRVKALASAAVMDRMIGAMAKRAGISKADMYSKLEFRKASEQDLPQGVKLQVEAWHGSPYAFDRFTTEKIGTGEGAQAFGWGLYFTDLESIAKNYAEKLAGGKAENIVFLRKGVWEGDWGKEISLKTLLYGGILDLGAIDKIQTAILDGAKNKESILKYLERQLNYDTDAKKAYDFVNEKVEKINAPSKALYKVSLHKGKSPSEYTWLEWDKPVSADNIIKINKALEQRGIPAVPKKYMEVGFDGRVSAGMKGKEVYSELVKIFGDEYKVEWGKQASLFLLENGIDGIKYPAESIARGATSDTARGFNYVVFDENAVSIEEVIKFQKDAEKARGAMMMALDGQAIIYALSDPNVSTPVHELAHVFEHYLTDAERAVVQSWAGTEAWTTKTSESFARGFEKYLADGKAPSSTLQKVFDKFKEWLTDIYNGVKGSDIDLELNDQMRELYSKMVDVSPKAKEIAGKLTERIKAGKQQAGDLKNIDADQYSEEREEAKTEYEAQLENELEELREAYADVTRSEAELRKIQNSKSKSLSKFVDRLLNGTTEQDVIDAKAKLADAKKKYREAKAALTAQLPRERGSNYIIERLSRAARQGEISQEAADLAIDLVRANPELFEDLAISITKAPQGSDALGFYRAAEALVKVFKGGTDDLTATHELLHHTERFLPLEIRDKILEEWSTQIDKQIADLKSKLAKEKNPDTRNNLINKLLYLGIAKERQVEPNAQNRKDMERIMAKYMRGYVDSKGRMQKGIGKDWYQYSNPSEWWAVNASKLYAEAKNKPQLRTWLDKAKAFYDQLIASAKRVFKGSRTAAVEKGLKAILNGETLSSREGEVLAQTKGLSAKGEVLFQLVGENAELAQDVRDNLQVARNMEAAGKDAKTIRIATGWEKGKDGKWRYEILDGHLKGEVRTFKGNLSDIIESKELFNAYPQLAKLEVDLELGSGLNGFDKGAYYARRSKIEVNGSRENVLPILLHEIQHAIQEIEGFAKGGNPSQMTTPNDVLQKLASPLSFPKLSKEDRLIAKQKTREQGLRFGETFYFDVIKDDIYELHDLVDRLEILNSVSPNEAYVKLIDALDYKIMEMRGENVAFDKYKKLVGEVEARNVQNRMGMTPEQRRETLLSETEDVARDEQIVLFDSNGIQMQVDAEQSDLQTIKDFIEEQRKEGVSEEDIKEGVRLAAKELGIKDVDSLFSEKDSTFDPKAEYEASFEGKASSRAIREAKMPFVDKYFESIANQLIAAKKIKRIC